MLRPTTSQKLTRRTAILIMCSTFMLLSFSPFFCRAVSLEDIEPLSIQGQGVLSALADLEDAVARRDHAAAQSGLRFFGNVGFGNNTEPEYVGATQTVNYNRAFGRAGLALPILGSWARKEMAVLSADARVYESKQRFEAAKALNLAAVRKAWAVRWVEREKRRLIDQFLAEERQTMAVLKKRMEERLLLPVDYHEFLTSFHLARRDKAVSDTLERQARTVVQLATGQDIPVDQVDIPDLPRPAGEERLRRFVMEDHPEILYLKNATETVAQGKRKAVMSDIDARLEVYAGGTRDFPGTSGYSTAAQLVLDVPLNIVSAMKASGRMADVTARKAMLNVRARQEQLLTGLDTALYARDVAVQNLAVAGQRLTASEEGIKRTSLRLAELPGDVLERHYQARALHLRVKLDALSAVDQLIQANVEILRVAVGPSCVEPGVRESAGDLPQAAEILRRVPVRAASSRPSSPPSATPAVAVRKDNLPWLGVYIWNAAPLLSKDLPSVLSELAGAGFRRLLVSLTGEQLNDLHNDTSSFSSFVKAARKAGCTVELVLAEPSWIEPRHRPDLIVLLQSLKSSLKDIPLSGIHLDIEQDQLPYAKTQGDRLSREFISTLKSAVLQSPWPVRVSIHPRYVDPQGPTPWMGKELKKAGVREVVLMAYTTSTAELAGFMRRILKANPELSLTLAQSIEEGLPAQNSFFSRGRTVLHAHSEELRKTLLSENYTGGIIIQSWEDYRKAPR